MITNPGSDERRITVLVVDDEPDMREVVRRILQRRGFLVLDAGLPGPAMDLARDHVDTLDLLLTDVRMPAVTGAELAARLRQLCPDLPVLYMSGFPGEHAIAEGMVEADATVLEKPFTPPQLVEAVKRAVLEHSPS
jgi:CheY-like chemotaxis protein